MFSNHPVGACLGVIGEHVDHVHQCQRYVTPRHNKMVDSLSFLCREAGMNVQQEAKGISSSEKGTELRPGDCYVEHWTFGNAMAMDVGIVNPLAPTHQSKALEKPTAPADSMYMAKKRDIACKCAPDIIYQPMVWTSLGARSSGTEEILRIIIYRLQQARDCTLQDAVAFVYGVLSVCLQSWNASMTNLITKALSRPKRSRTICTK